MLKKIKVTWKELHSQVIEADPESDELMMMVDVNSSSKTFKNCSHVESEIVGEVEADIDEG